MTRLELTSQAFVAAAPDLVADAVRRHDLAALLWPGQRLEMLQDRGRQGLRFTVRAPWSGSGEIWLQAYGDGVLVHVFLRVDVDLPGEARLHRLAQRQGKHQQRLLWRLKDELEAGREVAGASVGSRP